MHSRSKNTILSSCYKEEECDPHQNVSNLNILPTYIYLPLFRYTSRGMYANAKVFGDFYREMSLSVLLVLPQYWIPSLILVQTDKVRCVCAVLL